MRVRRVRVFAMVILSVLLVALCCLNCGGAGYVANVVGLGEGPAPEVTHAVSAETPAPNVTLSAPEFVVRGEIVALWEKLSRATPNLNRKQHVLPDLQFTESFSCAPHIADRLPISLKTTIRWCAGHIEVIRAQFVTLQAYERAWAVIGPFIFNARANVEGPQKTDPKGKPRSESNILGNLQALVTRGLVANGVANYHTWAVVDNETINQGSDEIARTFNAAIEKQSWQ